MSLLRSAIKPRRNKLGSFIFKVLNRVDAKRLRHVAISVVENLCRLVEVQEALFIEMLEHLDRLVAVLLVAALPLKAALVLRDALQPEHRLRMQELTRGGCATSGHFLELARVNFKQDFGR